MPEVVEVALTAHYLNDKLKNKKITSVEVTGGRYAKHKMKGLKGFRENLPMIVKEVGSKGKFMWFILENKKTGIKYFIMNTFGLEGEWGFVKKKHSDVLFRVKNKTNNKIHKLYFTDSMHYGTLKMTSKFEKLLSKINELGPDFLKTDFTNKDFYDRVKSLILNKKGHIIESKKNKLIIQILMDQKKTTGLGSGLGNYLSQEVLFNARMSPYTKLYEIYKNKKLSDRLAKSIRYILRLAYMTEDVGYMAHLDDNLDKWVKELREKIKKHKAPNFNYHSKTKIGNNKFEFKVYRQKVDSMGYKVKADKIIKGRTTYWSPAVQK